MRSHADAIIQASIQAVLPDNAVRRALEGKQFSGRVVLVAAGKAESAFVGNIPVTYEDGCMKFKLGEKFLSIYYLIQAE